MRRLFDGSRRALLIAIFCFGALTAGAPMAAQASFSSPYTAQCSGGEAFGINTELQTEGASKLSFEFAEEDLTSPLSCANRGPRADLVSGSSPEVLEALGSVGGARNAEFVFAGGEEPPTLSQWLNIDLGDKPGSDSGLIRQIPIASTAVVPILHFPTGCSIPSGEATADGRFTVSNAALEKVYAGATTTWGELLPDIASSCASLPIERVVPVGGEGTTFVFKQWLAKVNASRGWGSLANTAWPNDSGATATVRAGEADRGEALLVKATSGSVGFASLSDARSIGFGFFAPGNPHHEPGLFWLSLQNGAGEQVEPTRDPKSGADNVEGANCDNPTFNYIPSGYDTTGTPIWRAVTAVGSKTGWPICTLTYILAWDDASTVYGKTETVEAMQRTVKDYLAYALGAAGQEIVESRDYSKLPSALLADAQDGQSRVGWNKTPGSKEEVQTVVKSEISTDETHTTP